MELVAEQRAPDLGVRYHFSALHPRARFCNCGTLLLCLRFIVIRGKC